MSTFKKTAMAALASLATAKITEVGLWTGHDFYNDEHNIGVAHGIPYSNDAATLRMLNGPKPLEGDVTDYLTKANVQRVKDIMDEASFNYLFELKNDIYTYSGFLQAVGKFPNFCNESNRDGHSLETECKRELSTIFAHFVRETGYHSDWEESANGIDRFRQGLYETEAHGCETGTNSGCDYHGSGWVNAAWPNQPGKQYYPRGPYQLGYTFNYGMFSNIFKSNDYNSKLHLLKFPEEVAEDGYTAFAAALWYHMTPQSPKPSMHDIVTGYFIPNDLDIAAGIKGGFGSTTNALSTECGYVSAMAQQRADFYQDFLGYFELDINEPDLLCDGEKAFPAGGSGTIPSYFEYNWRAGHTNECAIVTWMTPYSLFAEDDYKRCVCDTWGEGEANCPQATSN